MKPKLKKGVKELVAEAEAEIEAVTAEQAIALAADPDVVLVDLRDIRELERDGRYARVLGRSRKPLPQGDILVGQAIYLFLRRWPSLSSCYPDCSADGAESGLSHQRRLPGLERSRWPGGI